jgi:hypothetical protein
MRADVSDPVAISKVEFFSRRDGDATDTLLSTVTVAPYTFNWANVPRGSYDVRIKATDSQGSNTLSNPIPILVYARPNAQLTVPAEGAAYTQGASITLKATAQTTNNDSKSM